MICNKPKSVVVINLMAFVIIRFVLFRLNTFILHTIHFYFATNSKTHKNSNFGGKCVT